MQVKLTSSEGMAIYISRSGHLCLTETGKDPISIDPSGCEVLLEFLKKNITHQKRIWKKSCFVR